MVFVLNGLYVLFLLIVLIVMVLVVIFGILFGVLMLCLCGDYLVIVMFGFGEIVWIFMNNFDCLVNIINGLKGIMGIDLVYVGGFNLL